MLTKVLVKIFLPRIEIKTLLSLKCKCYLIISGPNHAPVGDQ